MRRLHLHFFIIVIVGFLVFFNSLFNGFVWDDEEQIVNNVVIQDLKNIPTIFLGGAFNSGGTGKLLGIYYKPLMTLSFALIYSLFGLKPFFYHLASLLVYLGNGVLAYLFFSKFFGKEKLKTLLLSLLFVVHPLYSEVVLYMANMQDLLYFFFGMLSLFALSSLPGIFFLLSLLSKETGIVFVLVAILYTYLYRKEHLLRVFLNAVIALVFYALLRFKLAGIYFPSHDMAPIAQIGFLQRIMNIPAILSYYFKNFLLPLNLAINQHWVVGGIRLTDLVVPALVLIAGSFLVFRKVIRSTKEIGSIKEKKVVLLFFSVFVLGLLPHLQILPLDVTASGRWFYVSSLGVLGLVGAVLNKKAVVLLAIPIVLFSLVSINRTYDFRSGFTLYAHDLKYDNNNFNLLNNMGVEYYRLGRLEKSGEYFLKSVASNPRWWTNYNNLGVYYEDLGNFVEAEKMYKKAIDNGNYYLAYENYARILLKQKKHEQAKEFLETATKIYPYNNNLRNLYNFAIQKTDSK